MHTKTIFLTAGLWIMMPVAVFAQAADQATIAQLQAQIQALQNQIRQVQQQSIASTLPQKPVAGSIQESRSDINEVAQNIPNFARDLFFGMKNNPAVSDLQEFLTDQGYYAGPISGNFGLLTLSSVKKFQSAHGIKPTGYFGPRSRAIANEIVQKLVGQICPREEGCEGNILPVEHIRIVAESALEGVVGEYLQINFRASGGSGNYTFETDGDVPPGMRVALASCAADRPCFRDLMILNGAPTGSGVFGITIVAKDSVPSTDIGIVYGKERFTIVIKERTTSGSLPPVISGVKGPTMLKVSEEGIWTVNAYDPQSGSLSYRVVWGDESYGKESVAAAVPFLMTPFIQTATFSHIYYTPSVYTPIFSVVNEKGLGAKTSISVNVGSVIKPPPPIPVPTGQLSIDPPYAALKVGDSIRIKAIFTPPRPACLDATPSCEVAERLPYEVAASFVSDNAKIAAVETVLATCPVSPSGIDPTCPLPINSVRGVSAGDAIVTASYTENGRTHAAKMKVTVAATQPSITLLSPNGGETWALGSTHTISWVFPVEVLNIDIGLAQLGNLGIACPVYGPCSQGWQPVGTIAHNIVNSGSFTWTVENTTKSPVVAGQYKVSISDTAGHMVSDYSDAPFRIVASSTPLGVAPY